MIKRADYHFRLKPQRLKQLMAKIKLKIYTHCFDEDGGQKKWLVLLGVIIPILLSLFGILISLDNSDNSKSISKLTALVKNSKIHIDSISSLIESSHDQISYLQKIYIATDSTNKSTYNLRELPNKLNRLGNTIDTLNIALTNETKNLSQSYKTVINTYDLLINQQRHYLENIGEIIKLSNKQIEELSRNNKIINDEYSRRADLKINGRFVKSDKGYILKEINIENNGSLEARINYLTIYLNNENLNLIDSSIKSGNTFYPIGKQAMKLNTRDLEEIVIQSGMKYILVFDYNCYFINPVLDMTINYNYSNKFENKTNYDRIILPSE